MRELINLHHSHLGPLVEALEMMEESGYTIEAMFRHAGWNRVALYGGGLMGQRIHYLLGDAGVEIAGIVDRRPDGVFSSALPVVQPHRIAELGDIDAIIFTPLENAMAGCLAIQAYSTAEFVDFKQLVVNPIWFRRLELAIRQTAEQGARLSLLSAYLPLARLKNPTLREKSISTLSLVHDAVTYYPLFAEMNADRESASFEYCAEVFTQPPLMRTASGWRNADTTGRYLNILDGRRWTADTPRDHDATVHLYGDCHAFGVGVEDGLTIASQLQRTLTAKPLDGRVYRVVNHAAWGGERPPLTKIATGTYRENDICVVFVGGNITLRAFQLFFGDRVHIEDIVSVFDRPHDQGEVFYDYTHFNHRGAGMVADRIHEVLERLPVHKADSRPVILPSRPEYRPAAVGEERTLPADMRELLREYREYLDRERISRPGKKGCIVMNCNPFTRGHRHLIEQSAAAVEDLYVFCLEEDRSAFPFSQRMAMLEKGVADLPNVKVLASGKLIISALTFPEYFSKEQAPHIRKIPALDLEIFGGYIAPFLDITVRFAGEEPVCEVTGMYNRAMAETLPRYGIAFVEMPRLAYGDKPISASWVRAAIREDRLEELRRLVPESTLGILLDFVKENEKP